MPLTQDQLFQALVVRGAITEQQFETAAKTREAQEIGIGETLVAHGVLTEQQLGQLLAWWHKVPYFDFEKEKVNIDVLALIPEIFAREHKIISVQKTNDSIIVATDEPFNLTLRSLLEKYLRQKVSFVFSTQRDILNHFFLFQRDPEKAIDKILKHKLNKNELDTSAIDVVDSLINFAFQTGASDVHFEPEEFCSVVRFRTDGILHDVVDLPKEIHSALILRLKVMAKLSTDEYQKAQDGKILYKTPWSNSVDIRLSVIPTTHAEKAVLRLMSDGNRSFSLNDLGLQSEDFRKISNVIHQPWGMLLITGPTGSGKTTSLYSILKILNQRDVNITSIEDPVEYDMEGINQIQVNEKANLTFAKGLRSIVRQDPDIIMVGEIRDQETAEIALNAAMTGHLLLSTFHTNDAATTFSRLVDMGLESFLVASTVNAVVAQRLIRRVCQNCIQSKFLSKSEEVLINEIPFVRDELLRISGKKELSEIRFFAGKGCHICCETGYKNRIGIFEILTVDDKIREAIVTKQNAEKIKEIAVENGMTTMLVDGLQKAVVGLTTVDEVLKASRNGL